MKDKTKFKKLIEDRLSAAKKNYTKSLYDLEEHADANISYTDEFNALAINLVRFHATIEELENILADLEDLK